MSQVPGDPRAFSSLSPTLQKVMESAAKLQELVPDAVLVGGSAAALYAGHRDSFDHDHVVQDLVNRYAIVIDAVEASEGWATSLRASKPPFTVLGSLDGVEAGLRQLRRARPVETAAYDSEGGKTVAIPTMAEILRIKAYLVLQRNAVRDYLDLVALTDSMGLAQAAEILRDIDAYYLDRADNDESVLSALILKLAAPQPRDPEVTGQLSTDKALGARWQDWNAVEVACHDLSQELARQ